MAGKITRGIPLWLAVLASSLQLGCTATPDNVANPHGQMSPDSPCPMAGKTYRYKFNESFRGRARFTTDCRAMTIDLANGPATFALEKTDQGWQSRFDTDRTISTSYQDQGSWIISPTGTLLTFSFPGAELESRLIPITN